MLRHKIISFIVMALCLLSAVARKDRGRRERERERAEPSCEDRASWCKKIGSKLPLNRCYRSEKRCCLTCSRLKLTLQDCPFGDRKPWCSDLGNERPTSECYKFNTTCCQTCHLFDSGLHDCPYGDKQSWCSDIGTRYSVSSCYEHQENCCDTCARFETKIPECPYGDRLQWCTGIGNYFSEEHCQNSNKQICCNTCHLLAMKTSTTTTPLLPTTTPVTQRYGNTTIDSNSTTMGSIFTNETFVNQTERIGMDNKSNSSSANLNITWQESSALLTSSLPRNFTPLLPASFKTTLNPLEGKTVTPNTLVVGNISYTVSTPVTPEFKSLVNETLTSRDNTKSRGNETSTLTPKVDSSLGQRPHRHEKGSHNRTRDSHRKHHHRSRNTTDNEEVNLEPDRDNSDIAQGILENNKSTSDNGFVSSPPTTDISNGKPQEMYPNETRSKSDNNDNQRPKYLDPSQEFLENHLLAHSTTIYLSKYIYVTLLFYHIALLSNKFGES